MTADIVPERALDRRLLIRGGAVLAGAAGIAAVGAVVAPSAQAANGAGVVLGSLNTATATTTITESGAAPTLSLVNANGPALKLTPLSDGFDNPLAVGEIGNTETGPIMGVDYGDGVETTYLATGLDLLAPIAFTPERLIDTRDTASRRTIIGSSNAPFDTKGQLKAGAYIDISVGTFDDSPPLSAVFLNLTAVNPATGGFLTVYPSGFLLPTTSNLNFQPKVTIANAAFIAVGAVDDNYAIRVYAAKASHVLVDLTGVVVGGEPSTPPPGVQANSRQAQHARRLKRMRSAVAKTARR